MEQSESKYARKVKSGKQMYGPGCGANRLAHVEIHTGEIEVKGRRFKSIGRVPSKFLPIFTTQKTARPTARA